MKLRISLLIALVINLTGCVTQTQNGNLALAAPMIVAAPKDGLPWFHIEVPDSPSNPLFLLSSSSISSPDKPSLRSRKRTTPGSRSPLRVPMRSPSVGVNPMLVSTERP